MKQLLILLVLFFSSGRILISQNSLYDDSGVSSVFIEIHPDSLDYIFENVLSDHYFKARFIFDDGSSPDTVENAGFRLRGNTSRYSQKKSFKISFNEYVPGRRYQGVKKINLNGQHNDPTMVREKLFYETWKMAGFPERRTSFVRLYINEEYFGLYTNVEEFDKDWLQSVYGENEGNLYKCTYPADLVYLGDDQQTYKDIASGSTTGGRAYDLQTNEADDDYSDLLELIRILDQEPDSTFARSVASVLNVDQALKAFAMDVVAGNWDDYMYNKNNYFLYRKADGKFDFITYDPDNSFGVDWIGRDWATRNCTDWVKHGEPRPLATKLLDVPEFNLRYRRFLDTLAREVIQPDILFPRLDAIRNLISQAANDDTYRTLDYGYTFDDFLNGFDQQIDNHTPYGIKPFIALRQAKVFEQLGTFSMPDYSDNSPIVKVFPVPSSETVNIRMNGVRKGTARCVLTDSSGSLLEIRESIPTGEDICIDLTSKPKGILFFRIELHDKVIVKKILHL